MIDTSRPWNKKCVNRDVEPSHAIDRCHLYFAAGWLKSGDDSAKTYKGTIEIPNLSEEHAPEEIDVSVFTDDSSACAGALKDFIRLKGAEKIREKLGEYITNLKRGKFTGLVKIFHPCICYILYERIMYFTPLTSLHVLYSLFACEDFEACCSQILYRSHFEQF